MGRNPAGRGRLLPMTRSGRNCLLAVLLLPSLARAAEAPELHDFAARPDFRAPSVSPDGKYLAVVVGRQNREVLRTMDIKTMNVAAEVSVRESPDILDYSWVGDRRIVASFGKRSTGAWPDSDIGGEIFAINVDKSDGVYLIGNRPGYEFASGDRVRRGQLPGRVAEVLDGLVDDPEHAILGVYRVQGLWKQNVVEDVYKVDVFSGKRVSKYSVPDGTYEFLFDRNGRIRVASGFGERFDADVHYRARDDAEFKRLDALPRPGRRHAPAAFDDEMNAIYLWWADEAHATGIAQYVPGTDVLDLLWQDRDYDAYGPIIAQDGTGIVAIGYYTDKLEYAYFDKEADLSRLLASVQEKFPGNDITIVSYSREQDLVLIEVDGQGRPGNYYLANVASMRMEHLFNSRAAIDEAFLGVAEHFEIESRDGTPLRGYVIYPPGASRTNLPMVVLPYKEMFGVRHYNRFDPDVQVLASRGYAVLQVNPRGSIGYGIAFLEAGYRNLGTIVQDDITDAVRWAIGVGVADPERVCIAGNAFGAYSALMSAAREPELYACAIGYNGIYDLPLEFGADSLPKFDLLRNFVSTFIAADGEELARQSPVSHVEDIQAALLIAYDRFKRHSPPAQSKALMKSLDRAGIGYEQYAVQQRFKGIVEDRTRAEHYRQLLDFLDRHIGNASP